MSAVRPPQQERSKRTQAAIIAALDRLLREKSFEDVTVAEIASEADVSVGSVYRRFENKEALIPVLFELYMQRIEERHQAATANIEANADEPGTLRHSLIATLSIAWDMMEEEGHLLRAVHLYARLNPQLVGSEWEPLIEASRSGVRRLISTFADEISVPDEETAVDAITYFLNAILIEEGLYGDVGPPFLRKLNGRELSREMADFAYGYLTQRRD